MSSTDVVNEYIAIINKLEELRLLLKDKLTQLKVIDNDDLLAANMTFPKLLTKVNPTDINSVINKQLPNFPIDRTTDFVTDFKINGEYNQQYSIEAFNSLLIDKLNFYRNYLMYQLENMGIDKNEINQAITIKNLILLLDKIEKIKTIDNIILNETTLFVNQNNTLNVSILDETNEEVEVGTLEIYDNNICIYKKNIGEEVVITPTIVGQHTYTFRYTNILTNENNEEIAIKKYKTSDFFTVTFDIIYPSLQGFFTLQNITTTSEYYTGELDDSSGNITDKWNIDVTIFNSNGQSINKPISFDIYMYDDEHLVTQGVTNNLGHAQITNVLIPYSNSDFITFREPAVIYFTDMDSEYVVDDLNIKDLSFIQDPTLINGEITYERIKITDETYLDDLNDCITDIYITDDILNYTTFYTTEHILLEEIDNLEVILAPFITEIFYKNENVTYETVTNKKYEYDKTEPDYSVPLILRTTLNDIQYPNTELYHDINIYRSLNVFYVSDINMDTNGDLIIDLIERKTIKNSNIVRNISMVDENLVIESNTIKRGNDSQLYAYVSGVYLDENDDLVFE